MIVDADDGILLGHEREGTLSGGGWTSIRQLADAIEILVTRNRELANKVEQHHTSIGNLLADLGKLDARVAHLEERVEGLRPVVRAAADSFGSLGNAIGTFDRRVREVEDANVGLAVRVDHLEAKVCR